MPDIVTTFLEEVRAAVDNVSGNQDTVHIVPDIDTKISEFLASGAKRLPAVFIEDSGGQIDPYEGKYLRRRLRVGVLEQGGRDPLDDKLGKDVAERVALVLAAFNNGTSTSALFVNPSAEGARTTVQTVGGIRVAVAAIEYDVLLVRS